MSFRALILNKITSMGGYIDSLDPVIGLIKECEDGRSIDELLESPVSHSIFK